MENGLPLQDELSTYVVCRVKDNLCSINGRYVAGIEQMPLQLMGVPKAAPYIRGSYKTVGTVHTVVDLRKVFAWKTSQAVYQEFTEMIDARKQDHLNWVRTLHGCHESGQAFTLARDCHLCALGRWRDQYKAHTRSIQHLLDELDAPHEELHKMADLVLSGSEEGVRELERMEQTLVPKILNLLDQMKREFKETEFREMLIVIQGEDKIALTVDEVLSVESLEPVDASGTLLSQPEITFVRQIQRRPGQEELIMELDIPLLTASLELTEV